MNRSIGLLKLIGLVGLVRMIGLVGLVSLEFSISAQEALATLIIHNGTIYTVNATQPTAAAVAIRGDRILGVGSVADCGLTMVHDAGVSSGTIAAYQRLAAASRLKTRLYVMLDSSPETTGGWFSAGRLSIRVTDSPCAP